MFVHVSLLQRPKSAITSVRRSAKPEGVIHRILDTLQISQGVVLDLFHGTGGVSQVAAALGLFTIAVDEDVNMSSRLEELLIKQPTKVSFTMIMFKGDKMYCIFACTHSSYSCLPIMNWCWLYYCLLHMIGGYA